jgi:hypothetical protein
VPLRSLSLVQRPFSILGNNVRTHIVVWIEELLEEELLLRIEDPGVDLYI